MSLREPWSKNDTDWPAPACFIAAGRATAPAAGTQPTQDPHIKTAIITRITSRRHTLRTRLSLHTTPPGLSENGGLSLRQHPNRCLLFVIPSGALYSLLQSSATSSSAAAESKARQYEEIITHAERFFKKYDIDIVGKMATLW